MADEVSALLVIYKSNFAANPKSSVDVRPREIALQTHIASDTSQAVLDALLDKMRCAIERQTAFYDLQIAREELANHIKNLRQLESAQETVTEVARLRWQEQGRKGEWDPEKHLSAQEKTARKQNEGSLKSWREGALHWDKEVDRLVEIVHAHDIGSDRSAGEPDR